MGKELAGWLNPVDSRQLFSIQVETTHDAAVSLEGRNAIQRILGQAGEVDPHEHH